MLILSFMIPLLYLPYSSRGRKNKPAWGDLGVRARPEDSGSAILVMLGPERQAQTHSHSISYGTTFTYQHYLNSTTQRRNHGSASYYEFTEGCRLVLAIRACH